ncbi:MAG: hypothetical protein O2779_00915 [Nanoarchaeota archaeon]|nr:hypothetical protein [Nanoarchaeota archaeon]
MKLAEKVKPSFTRKDERGLFQEVLNGGNWKVLLQGHMKPDAIMGNHFHKKTDIFFFLPSGKADVYLEHSDTGEKEECKLVAQEGIHISRLVSHAIKYTAESTFILLKTNFDADDEDLHEHILVE